MPGPQRRGATGAGGGERRGGGRDRDNRRDGGAEKTAYIERVVTINRVAKVVKGGRRFSFTALVVVGDGDGTVGVGYGKAKEVPAAIAKGVEEAKKAFFKVPRIQGTIPHPIQGEAAAGVVLLRLAGAAPADRAEAVSMVFRDRAADLPGAFTVVELDAVRIRRPPGAS